MQTGLSDVFRPYQSGVLTLCQILPNLPQVPSTVDTSELLQTVVHRFLQQMIRRISQKAYRCRRDTVPERRMQIPDSAAAIEDLMLLPSNRFEALAGDRKGPCSTRINQQRRICFEWYENGPHTWPALDGTQDKVAGKMGKYPPCRNHRGSGKTLQEDREGT